MICSKCGFDCPSDAKFCTACGMAFDVKEEAVLKFAEDTAKDETEKIEKTEVITGEKSKKKFRISKKLAISLGVVLGVLIVAATVVALAFDAILYQFAPNLYSANIVKNTIYTLEEQLNDSMSSFMGIDVESKESTSKVAVSVSGIENMPGKLVVNLDTSRSEKDKEMRMKAGFSVGGADVDVLEAKWNQNLIAFISPEIMETALSIPSKNFGKEFNKNEYLVSLLPYGMSVPEDLDLSMGDLFKAKGSMDEKADKKFVSAVVDFMKTCEVNSKGTATVVLDGKETKVKKWNLVIEDEDVKGLIRDWVLVIRESEAYSMWFESMEADVDDLEALAEYIEFNPVTLTIYAYNDNLIRIEYNGVIDSMNCKIAFGFTSIENMVENFEFVMDAEYGGETASIVAAMEGNLGSGKEQAETIFTVTSTYNGEVEEILSLAFEVDFEQEEYRIRANADEEEFSMKGDISRKNGEFYLKIGGDGLLEVDDGEIELEITLLDKVDVDVSSLDKPQNLLKMEKEDIEKIAEDAMKSLEGVAQRIIMEAFSPF